LRTFKTTKWILDSFSNNVNQSKKNTNRETASWGWWEPNQWNIRHNWSIQKILSRTASSCSAEQHKNNELERKLKINNILHDAIIVTGAKWSSTPWKTKNPG